MQMHLLLFSIGVVVASNIDSSINDFHIGDVLKFCYKLKTKHRVVVGSSWGSLSAKQQNLWMKNRCDRYFCQPNRLEGVGIYKCDPVEGQGLATSGMLPISSI